MMTTETGRRLGTLRTDKAVQIDPDGVGSYPRTDYRPEHTPLLNDGRWHHWMLPGEDYNIEHDGAGWRVTCWSWPGGHTYRLADASTWAFVDRLPVDDGHVTLTPGRAYALRSDGHGTWTLLES